MIKRILFAISTVAILISCNGNGNGAEEKVPSIVLEEGTVADKTISFFATVTDADFAAYLCVEANASTPTADQILEKGTSIRVGEKVELTEYNRKYNTTYHIVVAAMNDAGKTAVETLTMMTGDQPTSILLEAMATTRNSFKFSIKPTNSEAVYYKVYSKGETATDADIVASGTSVSAAEPTEINLELAKGNYFVAAVAKKGDRLVRAKDLEFSIAGADIVNVEVKRVEAHDYGTDVLFDIYMMNSDINVVKVDCYYHEGSSSIEGEYTYSDKSSPEAGCVAHSYSYTTPTSGSRLYFTGGTVKVQKSGNDYTLIVQMTRQDEKAYDFTWTGAVQWK